MKAQAIGKKMILGANVIVNFFVLTVIVLLSAFAGYALWDSNQIFQAADKSNYAVYKPTAEDGGKSFMELRTINKEVFSWLNVYGTSIDYPVAQGENNLKYVNTNAEGQYSLSGAIFLDSDNSKSYNDFNSILYGHHMEKKAMFGEIGNFSNRDMFDIHKYGNLYFDGADHGIEFFAFVHTDAYDCAVYTSAVEGEERGPYLNGLLSKALYTRDIGVTAQDRIILLSTCSAGSTNGRDILAGRVTDKVYADTALDEYSGKEQSAADSPFGFVKQVSPWLISLLLTVPLLAGRMGVKLIARQRRRKSLPPSQDV